MSPLRSDRMKTVWKPCKPCFLKPEVTEQEQLMTDYERFEKMLEKMHLGASGPRRALRL